MLPELTEAAAAAALSSSAWQLHRRAAERTAAGARVLMLTLGAPDTPAPAVAVEAAVAALRSDTPALCAIAEAQNVPAAQVAVTPGAQAGLFLALKLLLGHDGGEVLLPAPCYSTYQGTVRVAGGTPVTVESDAAKGFALCPAALAAAVTPATRGVLFSTPNNPTGGLLSRDALDKVGALCEAHNLWCISDETYTHLVFNGKHTSATEVPSLAERAVVVGSFSKVLLRPGWRLGWLVAPARLLPPLQALCEASHFGLSPFLQHAACAVLQPAATLASLCAAEQERYQRRRDALFAALAVADPAGLVAPLRPEAGMFVLLDVRAAGVTSLAFAEHLLDAYDLACLPGEGFGGGCALGFLRVALVADEAAMADAGRRIAACASELAARPVGAAADSSIDSVTLAPQLQPERCALAGGAALFVVRLDASADGWTAAMLAGVRAAAGPSADVRVWRPGMPDAELAGVDAVFCWNPPPGLLTRLLPGLRLVASLGAGVDHCAAEHGAVAPAGVPLVRCVDPLAAQRLGNYVLWAALQLSRRMEDFAAAQARAFWDSSLQCSDPADTRVGVMGLGAMGAAAAEALARNGFAVCGWSRSGQRRPPGVPPESLFAGADALLPFLRQLDILVCVLPLTDDTRGLLAAAQLRALPAGASLVNVGRAECIVQADLLAALDDGHLSRAVLDVAPQEPLPADSPLWAHPRVRLTPHVAGHSSGAGAAQQVVQNWQRVREGQPLLHVVHPGGQSVTRAIRPHPQQRNE